jgi:Transposase IS116/IS110/IS902 family
VALPVDAGERIHVALELIDMLEIQIGQIERDLRQLARRQTGCRALMTQFGMGELSALVTLCELGDVSRMHASRQAVRMAGIDIGVHRSDRTSRLGKLTRQGSAELRWALYEAAQSACRPASPDHADYHALTAHGLSHTRASLTIARTLARRSYHLLRELGPTALDPISNSPRGLLPLSPPLHDAHPTFRPAPGAIEAPTPPTWRPTKDRAAAVAPPKRPINHHVTASHARQPRAQIRQGVHEQPQPHQPQSTDEHLNRHLTAKPSSDERSPGLIAPGLSRLGDPIVRRGGGDWMPGTAPRTRIPRARGGDPASGSECADRGFGVPSANSSRGNQTSVAAAAGVERKRI